MLGRNIKLNYDHGISCTVKLKKLAGAIHGKKKQEVLSKNW